MGNLYETIQRLCAEHGVTGYKMCADLGISRSALTDLKMGRKQTLSAGTLGKIGNYFSVSVDSLLGRAGASDVGFDEFTYAFNNEISGLSPEDKQKLLEMARIFKQHQQQKKEE